MRAALDIAAKDLRQKVRDRSALLIGIVAPVRAGGAVRVDPGRRRRRLPRPLGLRRTSMAATIAAALADGPLAGMRGGRRPDARTSRRAPRPRGRRSRRRRSRPPSSCPTGFSAAALRGGRGRSSWSSTPMPRSPARWRARVLAGFAPRSRPCSWRWPRRSGRRRLRRRRRRRPPSRRAARARCPTRSPSPTRPPRPPGLQRHLLRRRHGHPLRLPRRPSSAS